MSEYYYGVMAFHVIAVMSWMAMLFYLPRLFVYHAENKDKKEFVEVVKVQEFKLYKYIGAPAMWATVFSGVWMIYNNMELMTQPWMHAKLLCVVLLIIYSISLDRIRRQIGCEKCKKNGKFFRAFNEIPTLLAILIVTYVITKTVPVGFSIGISLFFIFIMFMILMKKEKPEKKEEVITEEEK